MKVFSGVLRNLIRLRRECVAKDAGLVTEEARKEGEGRWRKGSTARVKVKETGRWRLEDKVRDRKKGMQWRLCKKGRCKECEGKGRGDGIMKRREYI